MWRNIRPVEEKTIANFEKEFRFHLEPSLRQFLIDHNNGAPSPGTFTTTIRERRLEQFLDFSDVTSVRGAWELNRRLRERIGPKRIIIGVDANSNFVCVERDHKQQYIVVWSHVSGCFERCLADIPVFLQIIN